MTVDAQFAPGNVVRLSTRVRRLTAPNPGIMTGPGTNTYLVGTRDVVVIDPGPDEPAHLDAIATAGRGRITTIAVTHTHPDHWPGVPGLVERTGARVVGFGARDGFEPDRAVGEGDTIAVAGATLRAVHTPGHAANHLCFLLEQEGLLFSGDHIMNGSTVVITPPDGDMAVYLASLDRLRRLPIKAIAPAHGALITDPTAKIDEYVTHRAAREAEVLAALRAQSPTTVEELVATVYRGVAPVLHPVAQFSAWAHLRKLRDEGAATCVDPDDMKTVWEATDPVAYGAQVLAPTLEPAGGGSAGGILVATGVRKTYRTGAETVDALKGVDLTIEPGQFVAVMGPSGSGKTTLLNCLSGLDDIDEGTVHVGGKSIHAMSDADRTRHRAEAMGFIFQAFNLIPVFTSVENVELPLLLAGVSAKEARAAAVDTLQRVGLGHRLNHRPPELSGGEQQRVTVARALAGKPQIVWADEPTGNLDSETATQVMGLLRELHAEGLTLMLVTHDEGIGASAERRIFMRDGEVVADELQ